MFYSLPTETKLDIFKFLSYKELRSINQTNLYFYEFINKFQGELARKKFNEINIDCFKRFKGPRRYLVTFRTANFDFPLDKQFEKKWRGGLEKRISLYLPKKDLDKDIVICLTKGLEPCNINEYFLLRLPTIIKSKNDVKIVYYYLNKLFGCSFEYFSFRQFIFNPELIQLLFGNAKQFYIQIFHHSSYSHNIENLLQFTLNHLISETLILNLVQDKDMEKYINILFKILTKGNILEKIQLSFYAFLDKLDYSGNISLFYTLIVEYIATSKDCLKMVPEIIFDFSTSAELKLSERAEKVEIEQLNGVKYTNYQITNIFTPKVCFVFEETASDISTFKVRISMKN